MKTREGSSAMVGIAILIVVIVLMAAVVVPWVLSIVDSTRTTKTNGINPKNSGPGPDYGTMAIRFELTELVHVNETEAGMWVFLNEDTLGREWTIDGRITMDVEAVHAVGVLEFPPKTYKWTSGSGAKWFEYTADTTGDNTLSPGWYKYVLEFSIDEPGTLDLITWNFGTENRGEAGRVASNCFRDDDLDNLWEEFPLRSYPYLSVVLSGDVVTGPSPEPPEEEVQPLVDTETDAGTRDLDWMLFVLIGAIVFIVAVAAVIMIRL